jgi:hypothetical protein
MIILWQPELAAMIFNDIGKYPFYQKMAILPLYLTRSN